MYSARVRQSRYANRMTTPTEDEQFAASLSVARRISAWILGSASLLLFLACAILSYFTGNPSDFYGGIFYAVFPLITLGYLNFYLMRPGRDPQKTKEMMARLEKKQRKNAATTSTWNGWILTVASPFLLIVGVGTGLEEGIWPAIAGGLAAVLMGAVGILMIRWGRGKRRAESQRASKPRDI